MDEEYSKSPEKSGEQVVNNNKREEQGEKGKESLLPVDKDFDVRPFMRSIIKAEEEEGEEAKEEWDDDDSEYVMSEIEDDEFQEDGEAELDDFDEITEPEDDDSSGAEMVIENPFEEVEPASPSGVKLEAISLENIITSGRRRNQQFF